MTSKDINGLKPAQEYIDELWWDETGEYYTTDMIRKAQVDAYNQAIDDASKYASVEYENDYLTGEVDKESILKLKK